MCTEVLVIKGGDEHYCETVAELAEALDLEPEQVSPDPPRNCLCSAYLDKLRARQTTEAEGWPFPEFVIEVDAGREVVE